MTEWAAVVTSALDEVQYGIVLLDEDLQARFINRAYYRMWGLAPPPPGTAYTFIDLVEHARATGAYDVAGDAADDYVRARIAMVRAGSHPPLQFTLSNGCTLKIECRALPDGGRMLTYADVTDLVRTADKLRTLATIDDLTKLLNRRRFLESLDAEFARALRYDRPLSVLMCDVDLFKQINDGYGHQVGDEVLRALAERCRGVVRAVDILGRVGGEEFAAILTETDRPGALRMAERLCQAVAAQPFAVGEERRTVTISVGVAARRAHVAGPGDLLRLADRALYVAKRHGRNCVAADPDDAETEPPLLRAKG
jgi:diguanylate cyclase (GGDEF)-like protein